MNRKCFRTLVIFGAVLAGVVLAGVWTPPADAALFHRRHRFPYYRVLPPYGPAPLEAPPVGTPYLAPEAPSAPSPTAPPTIVMPTLPEGMVITVTRMLRGKSETVSKSDSKSSEPDPGSDSKSHAREIALPRQAAQQLADCWSPPLPPRGDTVEVTLRFGFNRSGAVLWPPRITYVKLGPGMTGDVVRASILDAIKACTPLHFTPAMAANIPGEPLSVRFIGRREDETGERN
jgi:hypothetical protein